MGKGMLIEGAVTNEETGETSEMKHYLLDTGFQLTTIVWITWIESYVHSDINLQVKVEGLALDSYAFVFELSLEFNPDSKEEMDTLLRDLKVGSFYLVQGQYGGLGEKTPVWCFTIQPTGLLSLNFQRKRSGRSFT